MDISKDEINPNKRWCLCKKKGIVGSKGNRFKNKSGWGGAGGRAQRLPPQCCWRVMLTKAGKGIWSQKQAPYNEAIQQPIIDWNRGLIYSFFFFFLWFFLSFFFSFFLSFLSFFLYFFLSFFLSFFVSFFLSVFLSFFVSFFLSVFLSFFLLSSSYMPV